MSSRQLRKLQKQKELELELEKETKEVEENEEESSEEEAPAQTAKPRVSLFAALGGDEDDQEEDDEGEEGQAANQDDAVDELPQQLASKSSKNKKKKKKKKKAAQKAIELEDHASSGLNGGDDDEEEDEIDKAVKALKISTKQNEQQAGTSATRDRSHTAKLNSLLSINTYHLKAINEMRALFGRDIISSATAEEAAEATNATNRRRNATQQVDLETFLRGPPGAKKLPEVTLRRNIFIQGRDHWPRQSAMGLSMKEIGKHAESTEYAFIHNVEYDSLQAVFFAYVQMGDPMRMVILLQELRECHSVSPLQPCHSMLSTF